MVKLALIVICKNLRLKKQVPQVQQGSEGMRAVGFNYIMIFFTIINYS
jgi:hypothetical protein